MGQYSMQITATCGSELDANQQLMFQMGGVGPMFGQLGFFFAFAGKDMEDKLAQNRYIDEAKRLLKVMDQRLEGRQWFVDDYSIADIAVGPWLNSMVDFYQASKITELHTCKNVMGFMERFNARPAVQRGRSIPAAPTK